MLLDAFDYIKTINISDNIEYDVTTILTKNNKSETATHTKNVSKTNIEIASMFNLNQSKCEISGLLHDISSILLPADMLDYAKKSEMIIYSAEERYPFLLHQRISRLIATELFSINDEDILSAIECHSTLNSNPTKYDMALFIADKLSWDQCDQPPFYDEIKSALEISLECACYKYILYSLKNNMVLYPHEWLLDANKYFESIFI